MESKAAWLNDQIGEESWTPQRVQLCLYAEVHDAKPSAAKATAKPAATSTKRKAKAPAAPAKRAKKQVETVEVEEQAPRRSQRKRQKMK